MRQTDNRKFIFLINPISGTRGKSSLQQLIAQKTSEKGIEFNILPTNAEGNYDFLRSVIEQEGITDIVICGGDGTVSAVMAALQGSPTRVGIIPMGSGNGLAFAARIPKDPVKALDIIFSGKASLIDGFLINGHFSCMLCGIGFDGKVAHEFALEHTRGLQTYVKVSMRNFFTARPYPFRITIPGNRDPGVGASANGGTVSLSVDAFFISVANGDQFGNHFTIAPKASLEDGLLDIVVVKKAGRFSFLLSVIRQVLGGYAVQTSPGAKDRRQVLYFRTPSLEIANPEYAPLHIDGDPAAPSRELSIRIVPKAIWLIQP
ncbi:diacylglycerol/lipid kinase family protein [Puia sp. P3]|uniref:diacylglycerol/lipid kinase family protein n=1 Tax=Puia sp. P3 TaxID=3423952 RepID=UPI003D677A39